jgi:hypothetical protein
MTRGHANLLCIVPILVNKCSAEARRQKKYLLGSKNEVEVPSFSLIKSNNKGLSKDIEMIE